MQNAADNRQVAGVDGFKQTLEDSVGFPADSEGDTRIPNRFGFGLESQQTLEVRCRSPADFAGFGTGSHRALEGSAQVPHGLWRVRRKFPADFGGFGPGSQQTLEGSARFPADFGGFAFSLKNQLNPQQ